MGNPSGPFDFGLVWSSKDPEKGLVNAFILSLSVDIPSGECDEFPYELG